MNETISFPMTTPSNYTYDTDKIEITGGVATLKLEQGDIDFSETFDNDTGFVYESDYAEFAAGLVRQKNKRPTNGIFYASFVNNENGSWGNGTLTGTLGGSALVSGGELDLSGGNAYIEYPTDNLTTMIQQGCIRIRWKPNYTGIAPSAQYLFQSNTSTTNRIQMRHNSNLFQCYGYNSSGVLIYNMSFAWVPASIKYYEIELNFDYTGGNARVFIDGTLKDSDTGTGTRTSNTLFRVGASSGMNSYIDDVLIFDAVQHTSNYTPDWTEILEHDYIGSTIILPEMEHTGDGTIKLFNSFVTTELGSPRYLLQIGRSGNYLYWNGSAWAVSDETYTQANDATTFNANCVSLPVDGENYGQFAIIFPDSNSLSSIDLLTANMNVDIGYYTDNPSILFNTEFSIGDLKKFIESSTKTGGEIKYILQKDSDWYWWDGSTWSVSDQSYAESSTATEIETNKLSFTLTEIDCKVTAFLHIDDAANNITLDSVVVEYTYFPLDVRRLLEGYGITSTVLSDRWLIDSRDEFAIPWVKDKTRMNFDSIETVEEYYNGNGSSTLMLNRRPVIALVSAEYLEGLVIQDLTSSIEVNQAEGVLKARSSLTMSRYYNFFTRGESNWKITYTYGYADYPNDIFRVIKLLVAAKALVQVGSRTGGGALTVQSYGRNYGSHGKYTDARKEFVSEALALMQKYLNHVTGS